MGARQLVLRALRGREIVLYHGTVGFNRPAEKLELLGASVLPEIEEAIELASTAGADAAQREGLATVLLVYFRLAAKVKHKNIGLFLMRLPEVFREQALRSIFTLWGPVGAAQKLAFPSRLLGPMMRLVQTGSSTERAIARRLLSYLIRRSTSGPRRLPRQRPVGETLKLRIGVASEAKR
jgi:hypothetical protein